MVEHVLRRLNPTGIREGEENDGFEWIKAAGAVAPPCPANSAAASSTLMEAYNASSSSVTLSVAPCPHTAEVAQPDAQQGGGAAHIHVFAIARGPKAAPPRLLGHASALDDDPYCSDPLPSFPVLDQAMFLLRAAAAVVGGADAEPRATHRRRL